MLVDFFFLSVAFVNLYRYFESFTLSTTLKGFTQRLGNMISKKNERARKKEKKKSSQSVHTSFFAGNKGILLLPAMLKVEQRASKTGWERQRAKASDSFGGEER